MLWKRKKTEGDFWIGRVVKYESNQEEFGHVVGLQKTDRGTQIKVLLATGDEVICKAELLTLE